MSALKPVAGQGQPAQCERYWAMSKRHQSVTQRRENRCSKWQFMLPQRPLQSGSKHVQIADK